MIITEPLENLLHAKFETQMDLAATFIRFQEHYESPEFKDRIFTLEEYKQWYAANSEEGRKTGKFTYYLGWTGFNIPSPVFQPFHDGKFDPLSGREVRFLNAFKGRGRTPFYVIGTLVDADLEMQKHEIAHGLFYLDVNYQKEILDILNGLTSIERQKIEHFLANIAGYHPAVFDDEIHAYLLAGSELLASTGVEDKNLNLKLVHEKLERAFEKFYTLKRKLV